MQKKPQKRLKKAAFVVIPREVKRGSNLQSNIEKTPFDTRNIRQSARNVERFSR